MTNDNALFPLTAEEQEATHQHQTWEDYCFQTELDTDTDSFDVEKIAFKEGWLAAKAYFEGDKALIAQLQERVRQLDPPF